MQLEPRLELIDLSLEPLDFGESLPEIPRVLPAYIDHAIHFADCPCPGDDLRDDQRPEEENDC